MPVPGRTIRLIQIFARLEHRVAPEIFLLSVGVSAQNPEIRNRCAPQHRPVFRREWDSLDGTWNRGSGSDAWDGSGITGQGYVPGPPAQFLGDVLALTEGSTTYLRIQDPGDTRSGVMNGVNAKIYFGRNLTDMYSPGFTTNLTLSFRARIPTTGPLDPLYLTQGSTTPTPYPSQGDGMFIASGSRGLGMFTVKEQGVGAPTFGFSLTTTFDVNSNTNVGNAFLLNNGRGYETIPLDDPTVWHEFWITIGPSATTPTNRIVSVYIDGALTPLIFDAANGFNVEDYNNYAWLGMGLNRSDQSAAVDVDFFAVKLGIWAPIPEPTTVALVALGGMVLVIRHCRRRSR